MCDSAKINDEEDKEMEMLKKYEILYTAYADEIRNLWTRSVFLGAFMTVAWGGYGALQLKFITRKCGEFDMMTYYITSLGLCAVIIILSLLWIAMAKGSKFVQEAHEKHIERHTKKYGCSLFCDLHKYERMLKPKLCKDLLCCGTLKPYRYSPSKINIALGWTSILIACILVIVHIYRLDIECLNTIWTYLFMLVFMLALCPLSCFIKKQVKGGETDTRLHFFAMHSWLKIKNKKGAKNG